MKNLQEICADMADEIRNNYNLGPDDAVQLFTAIYGKLMNEASALRRGTINQRAVGIVADEFGISPMR